MLGDAAEKVPLPSTLEDWMERVKKMLMGHEIAGDNQAADSEAGVDA